MPWKECSAMSLREEFVALAMNKEGSMSVLCRRFGISRKTGYKWLGRFKTRFDRGADRQSRRPHKSPGKTDAAIEARVVQLRQQHRAWGGRKIKRRLADLGQAGVGSAGTVTKILRRHGLIEPSASRQHRPFVRFEHAAPNDLWQMDFKGHFPLDRRRAVSSADGAGRSLPILAGAARLRRRADRKRCRAT